MCTEAVWVLLDNIPRFHNRVAQIRWQLGSIRYITSSISTTDSSSFCIVPLCCLNFN